MRIFSRVLFVWVALMFSLANAKEQQPNVSRVLKQLDHLKLANNTIVVFTSPKSSNVCER